MGRYRRPPHVSPPAGPTYPGGVPSCAAVPAAAAHAVSAAAALPAAADARAGLSAAPRSAAAALPAPPGPASTCRTIIRIRCAAVHPRPRTVPAGCTGTAAVRRCADRFGSRPGYRPRCHRRGDRLAREHPFGASGRRHRHENDIRCRIDHTARVDTGRIDPSDNDVAKRSACADRRAGPDRQPDLSGRRHGQTGLRPARLSEQWPGGGSVLRGGAAVRGTGLATAV